MTDETREAFELRGKREMQEALDGVREAFDKERCRKEWEEEGGEEGYYASLPKEAPMSVWKVMWFRMRYRFEQFFGLV